jgi:UDP-glucuronate decarboxylase
MTTAPVAAERVLDAQGVIRTDLDYICDALADDYTRLAGRRLLITGGAGFLGYYLVQSVLHWNRMRVTGDGCHVTVYDNFVRGVPPWLTRLRQSVDLELTQHDVTKPLPADMGSHDFVIHAASVASPTYYRKYPLETMDANVTGLRNLLDYARQQQHTARPVRGLLFFSSSEIYGDPSAEAIPTPETYRGNVSCTGPRACYDEAKRFGETLCVTFARHLGLPITVVRPFNNYGPGLKITDRRVLPDFARDIMSGRNVVLLSDGSPRRTFCYVADAVVGYYKVLLRGTSAEAYNIGTETPEISIAELAERLVSLARELFGYRGRVIRGASDDANYLVDNPDRRCPVIAKARRDLGYDPRVTLDEGLRRALLWYHEHRHGEDA